MPPSATLPRLRPPQSDMRFLPYLLFAALAVAPLPALALERAALVIGNDAYASKPLKNAVNDARAVRDMLVNQLGFPAQGVIYGTDLNRADLYEKLEAFSKAASGAKIAFIYYAGHGMESLDGKQNFVLPVDVKLADVFSSEAKLRAGGVNLEELIQQASEAAPQGAKIVLLDCCRERPSARGISRAGGGLAIYADDRIPADTLVLLAAAPNKMASDGEGHGPFTRAVLDILPRGGGSILDSFFAVSDRVIKSTQKQQIPWMKFDGSGGIFRDNYFLKPGHVEMDPVKAATRDRPFVNSLGMEFIPVPGKPGLLMCRTETRVRDFRAYAKAADYTQQGGAFLMKVKGDAEKGYSTTWELDSAASWEKPGFPQTEDHPVSCVQMTEAEAFCEWLSRTEGRKYRLPTDEEWSAAVGVGKYPWGSTWPPPEGVGNYFGKEAVDSLPKANWKVAYEHRDGYPRTAPVGSFAENRNGFYDLGGNLWEWCSDRYRASMNSPAVLEEIPVLKKEAHEDGTPYRVLRGGSWDNNSPSLLLSSCRGLVLPTSRGDNCGFRCVLVVSGG